jgi:hypothetical protein
VLCVGVYRRVRGDAYYQLLDEFLSAVKRRYGNTTLIHFSDMSYDNASKLLNMYRTDFPCFSDELQVGGPGQVWCRGSCDPLGPKVQTLNFVTSNHLFHQNAQPYIVDSSCRALC